MTDSCGHSEPLEPSEPNMNVIRRFQSRHKARVQAYANMSNKRSSGFTLVEILVVIVIIGILAGLLLPAVNAVRRSVNTAYLRSECASIATAVEAYKLKYGDYPPDFSSWDIVQRHYRKVFPEILDGELTLLYRLCDNIPDANQNPPQTNTPGIYVPCIMDRAESIVWSLGGFSSDPQQPFTGKGGPLSLIAGRTAGPFPGHYQYNSARDNALMEFEPAMLSIQGPNADEVMGPNNRTESNDDVTTRDLFPVYRYKKDHAPYVYFDARTYRASDESIAVAGTFGMNGFATKTDSEINLVRPTFSDRQNTSNLNSFNGIQKSLRFWEFANPKTFQVLSPGLDGVYGRDYSQQAGATFYWQYPTGKMVLAKSNPGSTATSVLEPTVSNYDVTGLDSSIFETFERDNVGSFTSSSFEDDLP